MGNGGAALRAEAGLTLPHALPHRRGSIAAIHGYLHPDAKE